MNPKACAVLIIIFDFYWIVRTVYLTTLLLIAHHKLHVQRNMDWLERCRNLSAQYRWQSLYHLVIFPVYKEDAEVLRFSLAAIRESQYPKEKIIVVLGFEQRNHFASFTAKILEEEFKGDFLILFSVFHPQDIPGETQTKGANATWAAKQAKDFLDQKHIKYEDVVLSCFDADTCVHNQYFACLSHYFLTVPFPHQASYQPVPVYNNNIWHAPSFARIVEISSSFTQMIESMRLEKFVTFSSHSMSFKALVDINYWPVDMISDDSVVYWKAFLFYKGQYRVVPLPTTVSMDVAYSKGLFRTIVTQYKQKRRWAWGVENFPFLVMGFKDNPGIPFLIRLRRTYNLLESHVTWAVWAVIITFISPLPVIVGGVLFQQMPLSQNLPQVTGLLLRFTLVTSLIWVILSRLTLPARPRDVSWMKNIVMFLEWAIVPFVILILGSTPALDAQTCLLSGRRMKFVTTPKIKRPNAGK